MTVDEAIKEIDDGYLDMVTWGRAFIANPDFAKLILKGLRLRKYDDSMRKLLI